MPSVKRNFAYNVAYQVLAIIRPLATSPWVSRVLGADGVGSYSYTYSIASYFVAFAMLGVCNYGNRCVARARDDRAVLSRAFWSIWALQAALSAAALALYVAYAILVADDAALVWAWCRASRDPYYQRVVAPLFGRVRTLLLGR